MRIDQQSTVRFGLAILMTALLLAGCGQAPSPGHEPGRRVEISREQWPSDAGPVDERAGCGILAGEAESGAAPVVVLTDSVSPLLAPIPHNPSERLVFAHLYETLVKVDCEGHLEPGLASSWSCTEDSTLWVFTLRPRATFWDGTPVTAGDVAAAWSENQGCPYSGDRTPLWTWFNARAKAVTLLKGNRLSIRLPEPQARFPRLLAHPATAVAVRREGWTWPVGSGPLRLRASTPEPLPELLCRPNIHHPEAPAWKSLTFRVEPGADPRDLAAEDIDLVWTAALDAVRFFRDLPGFQAHPLPWNRIYLLICPPDMNPGEADRWAAPVGGLAPTTDLTRVDARSWHDLVLPAGQYLGCPQLTGPITHAGRARREWNLGQPSLDDRSIAYAAGDEAARELANRLAALGPDDVRAVPVHPGAVDFLLHWQMAGAVVVAMDQEFSSGCLQAADLLGKASWLQSAALASPPRGGHNPDSLVQARNTDRFQGMPPGRILMGQGLVRPLAVTRRWLVTRGEWAGLELDFDGTPRLQGLGRPRRPGAAP